MKRTLRRCRPLLGTLVDIRVDGLREADALAAIDAAFAEIAQVHRLMSFHEAGSDLSRLHCAPPGTSVAVDARTTHVLALAQQLAQQTRGVFDITIAPSLVRASALPRPVSTFEPDPAARWHDIELLPGDHVQLRRPLWLDLGGIAKGYAVDRAVELLCERGAAQVCVNAGGDLRVHGPQPEAIFLRNRHGGIGAVADLELCNGAIATSACDDAGVHVDGATRTPIAPWRTVSVLAPRCVVADALTKIVLADGNGVTTRGLLAAFGAQACVRDGANGWRQLERAA